MGHFCRKLLLEIKLSAGGENASAFLAGLHAMVKVLENGQHGLFESGLPIERATLRRGGTIGVHPIHAVFIHQANQTLG